MTEMEGAGCTCPHCKATLKGFFQVTINEKPFQVTINENTYPSQKSLYEKL